MAIIDSDKARVGQEIGIRVRKKLVPAVIVKKDLSIKKNNIKKKK